MELPNAYWIYFAPFAFLTGIPWQDAVQSGSVMATKLLSNEFVAMQDLGKASGLSEHAKGITSVFLVSFANFSSIGIISGAIKSLNDEKGDVVARFGIKLLFAQHLFRLYQRLLQDSLSNIRRFKQE